MALAASVRCGVASGILALAVACDAPGGHIENGAVVPWRSGELVLAVPDGAKVVEEPGRLQVDATDGSRWFDVRWVAPPDIPAAVVDQWGKDLCAVIQWDHPETPIPGTTTMGGLCTIERHRHWAITVMETRGEDTLLTLYAADARRLTFEDAWVDFVRTALSTTSGGVPLETIAPPEVRQKLREASATDGQGRQPIPGGGELAAAVSRRLVPVWQAREAAPPPRF